MYRGTLFTRNGRPDRIYIKMGNAGTVPIVEDVVVGAHQERELVELLAHVHNPVAQVRVLHPAHAKERERETETFITPPLSSDVQHNTVVTGIRAWIWSFSDGRDVSCVLTRQQKVPPLIKGRYHLLLTHVCEPPL
jgi:hypothetical protein